MSKLLIAQRLLSLFTSPECAEAMTGDFVEARGQRGAAWVWWQVLSTALALCARALTTAPLASVGMAALGGLQFGSLAFAGFAPVALFPVLLGSKASWIWLAVTWWSGAFFTGFTLVSLSPARGAAVSVLLALMGEGLLIGLRLAGLDGGFIRIPDVVFGLMTTLTAMPVLAGATIARRRILAAHTVALPR